MKRLAAIFAVAIMILPGLTGCWDTRNIREMDYVSAIGIDWEDQEYIVYVQLVDLDAFSISESGLPEKPLTTWVGKGKGRTIDAAVQNLYQTAEKRLFWGQLNSIVYSHSALENGIDRSFDTLNRYQEMRYHVWIFGTSDPIEELFFVTPFFNTSPLDTLFYNPEITYQQASFVQPLLLQELVRHYAESGATTVIPDISLIAGSWSTQKGPRQVLSIQGAHFVKPDSGATYMEINQLLGMRWMNETTVRSQVRIGEESEMKATVSLEHPRVSLQARSDATFSVKVHLKGNVTELLKQATIPELEREAEAIVEREIRATYTTALEHGVDVYNLKHAFYRRHSRKWHELQQGGGLLLNERSLADIEVEVILIHTGKFNLNNPS